jgi:hypothetical protein
MAKPKSGEPRNFVCPITEVACVHPDCSVARCMDQERENERSARAAEQDLIRRVRQGIPVKAPEIELARRLCPGMPIPCDPADLGL